MSQPAFKPGDVLGHYRLSEKIGKGGQGEVWRARDLSFDRDVAVKILPPNVLTDESARRRFHKEARAGQLYLVALAGPFCLLQQCTELSLHLMDD